MDDGQDELLQRCIAGDQRAWSELIRRHSGLVYAIARRHGLPEDVCDDVAQLVFATLLRRLRAIRDGRALPAWLITTTRRACWRAAAARRDRPTLEDQARAASPADDSLEVAERAFAVRRALDELGGKCRELLMALFAESVVPDYRDLAVRMNMPIGSIGPTRARCLAKLADLLRPRGADDRGPRT